jgi:putative flavoprotein involved in K+ transport
MHRARVGTLVIGAGQAGLAAGYHLQQHRLPFVIVDEHARIGDSWRNRWDTLRLFTPARYNGLPGMPFPGPSFMYPSKDQAADYLETYARHFSLPVQTGTKVHRLSAAGDRFKAFCGDEVLEAEKVVVAAGGYHHPRVPAIAAELDAAILQLHSSRYRNRTQLQEGSVLVVGAGNSGSEIAMDLAAHRQVWLSGPDTGRNPPAPAAFRIASSRQSCS